MSHWLVFGDNAIDIDKVKAFTFCYDEASKQYRIIAYFDHCDSAYATYAGEAAMRKEYNALLKKLKGLK